MSLDLAHKMGKWPYRHDSRVLRFHDYLTTNPYINEKFLPTSTLTLSPPPVSYSVLPHVKQPFPLDGNSTLGDCTIAAAAHLVQVWSALVGHEIVPNTPAVEKMYFNITGGSDVGAAEANVLKYWKRNPKSLNNWAPEAYLACDPSNPEHIKQAITLFGGCYIGLQLPLAAHAQFAAQKEWDIYAPNTPGSEPGSWGGHAVNVVAYDQYSLTVVTWGTLQRMTWRWWASYCDESWAILPNEWQQAPGFNYAQLRQDLLAVAQ